MLNMPVDTEARISYFQRSVFGEVGTIVSSSALLGHCSPYFGIAESENTGLTLFKITENV